MTAVLTGHEHQLVHQMDAVDELLTRTADPHHRRILLNFRQHVLLEVAGRHHEFLTPAMMAAEPVYRLSEGRAGIVLSGLEEIGRFYDEVRRAEALVLWTTALRPAVADWGFAAEAWFHRQLPGRFLARAGADVDDPAATYLVSCRAAFIWPYDEQGRLEGEHVYEDPGSVATRKLTPADVITPGRAAELLAPVIAAHPGPG
ncbi:hypothetical protein [Amycolatopsis tucumanensis]|uniref:hypothetical protein n=1 Tax=Amycolatopsis tucumanensis TaxID=401106 RepID=UPI003D71B81F